MEEKGIEGLKKVLDLVLTGVSIGKSAMADGKIGAEDLGLLMQLVPVIGPSVDSFGEVIPELKDLSEAEGLELIGYIGTKLAIDSTKAQLVVEKGLKIAVAVYEFVKAVRA